MYMNDTIIDSEYHINPFSKDAIGIAARFDAATDKKDLAELRNLIAEAQILAESESLPSQAYLFYSIGTVFSDFYKIEDSDREKAIEKQIYFFRKSIKLLEQEECADPRYEPYVLGLKQVLYTNYGNALDSYGRTIAAIEQYKKVVATNKDFGMALGNLGRVYQHYGWLEYDEGHRDIIHHFAYQYLKMALESEDSSTHSAAKKAFKAAIERYNPEYVKKVLIPDLKLKQFTYEDAEEYLYRM